MNKAELNDLNRTDNLPQMIQKVKEDTQKYWSLEEVKKNQWHIHKPLSSVAQQSADAR